MMWAMGEAWKTPLPSLASFPAPAVGPAGVPCFVAQSSSGGGSAPWAQSVVVWSIVMLGAIIVGAVVLFVVRRRMLSDDGSDSAGMLSLQDLREMRDRGELSEEEFEAAKGALLGRPLDVRERRANPGFDLTGEPLPSPGDGTNGFDRQSGPVP